MNKKIMFALMFALVIVCPAFATAEVTAATSAVPIAATILNWILGVFGSAIVVLFTGVVKRLFHQKGIELNDATMALLEKVALVAVNNVESWAAKQAAAPTSDEKLKKGVEILIQLANDHGLGTIASAKAEQYIEHVLQTNLMVGDKKK